MSSEPVVEFDAGAGPGLSPAVVERAEVSRISLPIDPPMISGAHHISSIDCNVVELTAAGRTGVGYTFAFSPLEADSVTPLIRHLGAPLPGLSLSGLREFSAGMWERINFVGRSGV